MTEELRKTSREAFVALWRRWIMAILSCLKDGIPFQQQDRGMRRLGLRMTELKCRGTRPEEHRRTSPETGSVIRRCSPQTTHRKENK